MSSEFSGSELTLASWSSSRQAARHARASSPARTSTTTRSAPASVPCTLGTRAKLDPNRAQPTRRFVRGLQQVLLLLERAESRPAVLQWSRAPYGLLNKGANARARVHRQPPPLLPWSASGLYMASNAVRPLEAEAQVDSTRCDALLDHSWRQFDGFPRESDPPEAPDEQS